MSKKRSTDDAALVQAILAEEQAAKVAKRAGNVLKHTRRPRRRGARAFSLHFFFLILSQPSHPGGATPGTAQPGGVPAAPPPPVAVREFNVELARLKRAGKRKAPRGVAGT